MKYAIPIIVILVALAAARVEADVQNGDAGAVVIFAADELGAPLYGFTVQARFPYEDGELDNDMDIVVTKTDGADDDVKKLKSATEDGDVEIAAQTAKRAAPKGGAFEALVSTPGFVDAKISAEYDSKKVNSVKATQKYILKITVVDRDGKPAKGCEVSVDGGAFARDGEDMDADGVADGILYIYNFDLKADNDKTVSIRAKMGKRESSGAFPVSKKVQKPVLINL